MTVARNRSSVQGGYESQKPDPTTVPGVIWCSVDTGKAWFSDSIGWHQISAVSPGGPGNVLDYDTGNTSQFLTTFLSGSWSLTFNNTLRRISSGFSGRFEVRAGDDPLNLGTERAEFNAAPRYGEGADVWVGWSTYLPNNTPTGEYINPTPGRKTNEFSGFHADKGVANNLTGTGIPPFALQLRPHVSSETTWPGSGWYVEARVCGGSVVNGSNVTPPTFYIVQDPVVYNAWTDWIVHIVHSNDASLGKFEIWVNGVRPSTVPSIRTLATRFDSRSNYFQQGYYRNANTLTSVCYHDMTMLGTSKAAVDPARFD